MTADAFVEMVARLRTNDEIEAEAIGFRPVIDLDDAISALDALIYKARDILCERQA